MIPILLKLKQVAVPIVRGTLKGFPMINAAVESFRNKSGAKVTVVTETGDIVTGKAKNMHNWVSICMQFLVAATLIYAWATDRLDMDKLLEYLQSLM